VPPHAIRLAGGVSARRQKNELALAFAAGVTGEALLAQGAKP